MTNLFRGVSDFWNLIMENLYDVISSFSVLGGETFGKIKDEIAALLSRTADIAEEFELT